MRNWLGALLLSLCLTTLATNAGAQQAGNPLGLSEVRGGIMFHSVDNPGPTALFGAADLSFLQDANVELLFTAPDADFWRLIGNPRPGLGATFNFGGLESMAHAGLTWHIPVFDTPIFIEGTLGGAIHNGALTGATAPARNHGCSFAFYEAASLGYQINENASVMLTFEHASHAGLCGPVNRGLTNLGVRAGWTF